MLVGAVVLLLVAEPLHTSIALMFFVVARRATTWPLCDSSSAAGFVVPALEDSVVFFVHSVGLSPFSVWPGALALTLRGHPDGCTPLVFTRAQLSPL